jgi:hypothetical protein
MPQNIHPADHGNADKGSAGHNRLVDVTVNDKPVKVPQKTSGKQIVELSGLPADFKLYIIRGSKEVRVGPDEQITVHEGEAFLAAPTLDPAFVAASPLHHAAIQSVIRAFAGHEVDVYDPGDGTTVLVIREIEVGAGWNHPVVDLELHLQVTFPTSPPYPYYVVEGLARTDGNAFSQIQPHVVVAGQSRTQVSLQKPFDPTLETLGARLTSVVDWLRDPR